ncbi:MAG: endonuclease III [Planctomycetota bacterium]
MRPRRPAGAAERVGPILDKLRAAYPDATCALRHTNALELLVATILSAQCTDERVNIVTQDLFARYRTARDYAASPAGELEKIIRSTGFFNSKARSLRGACQMIVERHRGRVPESMDELVALPGVARKTANVVLGTWFGIASGIVVDTHVERLATRMGLTREKVPLRIEQDLLALVPREEWIAFSHRMIWHGRRVCDARKPRCGDCCVRDVCPRVGVKTK